MVIGICRVHLMIHGAQSLKDKRQVLKNITARIRNNFNVSVAEVGNNDIWQTAELGVSAVGNDRSFVNAVLDKVVDMIEEARAAEITEHSIELMNY